MMERVQLHKNMVERERMFHVRNGNVKGLRMGMNSAWSKQQEDMWGWRRGSEEKEGGRRGTETAHLPSCGATWALVQPSEFIPNTVDSIRRFGAENESTGLLA